MLLLLCVPLLEEQQVQEQQRKQLLERLAKEINRPYGKVCKTVELLDDGNTIPFIARYPNWAKNKSPRRIFVIILLQHHSLF